MQIILPYSLLTSASFGVHVFRVCRDATFVGTGEISMSLGVKIWR